MSPTHEVTMMRKLKYLGEEWWHSDDVNPIREEAVRLSNEIELLRAENSALRSALDIAKEALGLIVMQRENFPEAAAERSLGFAVDALEELKTRGEK